MVGFLVSLRISQRCDRFLSLCEHLLSLTVFNLLSDCPCVYYLGFLLLNLWAFTLVNIDCTVILICVA